MRLIEQGLPGKDGETGPSGPSGPAVSIDIHLLDERLFFLQPNESFFDPDSSLSVFQRVLLEREESKDSLDPLDSRYVALPNVRTRP